MRWLPAAVMLLASTGCATAPIARSFESLADYSGASFTEAWDLVVDVFGDRDWAIDNLERDSGSITSQWTSDDDISYRDCGRPGLRASFSNPMGRFEVVVREIDVGVSVRVTTSWRVTKNTVSSIGLADCLSTGVLERELHLELRRRLVS